MNTAIAEDGLESLSRDPYLALPLEGIRLIEASAGTGKTFTLPRCSPAWWWSRACASARSWR